MDDNVSSLYCIDFAESKGDQIKMKKTYLTTVLSHLWNQFDPKAEIPKELRSPHCTKVFDYSGEPDMYGVLGMKFDRLGYKRPPFRHARLAALYLLNVKATVEKNVFFMPTPFLEDVMFCDDCDSEGLLCCKYGRFVFVKALVEGADKFTTSGVKSFREPKAAVSVRGPLEGVTLSAESDVILSTEPQTAVASGFFAEDVAASGVEQELDVIHNSDSSEKKEGAVTSDSLGEITLFQLECRCRDSTRREILRELLKNLRLEYDMFSPCYQCMIKDMSSSHLQHVKRIFEEFQVGKSVDSDTSSNVLLFLSFIDNDIVNNWPNSVGLFLQLDLENRILRKRSSIRFAWALPIELAVKLKLSERDILIEFLGRCNIEVDQCKVHWTCCHKPDSPYSVAVVIVSKGSYKKFESA